MCTITLSIDDQSMVRARRAFKNDQALNAWMQQQLMSAIERISEPEQISSSWVSELCGKWDDERSAEMMVENLRDSRVTNRDIEL